ncbi:ProQ/FinO family protein [Candidatus Jidaibacter acanthamoebae]|nr:ProQ/FinO family protein [Candidatus Jidaibacter acanthamoeba]
MDETNKLNSNTSNLIDNKAKKPKSSMSKEAYIQTLQFLITQFPNVFSDKNPKILKIKIHKDLKEKTNLSNNTIKHFLGKYCRTKKYKAALVETAPRYDLEGNIAGHVTIEETPKTPDKKLVIQKQ